MALEFSMAQLPDDPLPPAPASNDVLARLVQVGDDLHDVSLSVMPKLFHTSHKQHDSPEAISAFYIMQKSENGHIARWLAWLGDGSSMTAPVPELERIAQKGAALYAALSAIDREMSLGGLRRAQEALDSLRHALGHRRHQ